MSKRHYLRLASHHFKRFEGHSLHPSAKSMMLDMQLALRVCIMNSWLSRGSTEYQREHWRGSSIPDSAITFMCCLRQVT